MAIAKRPVQHRTDIDPTSTDVVADRFIHGGAPPLPAAKKQIKEPIIIRFDPAQLAIIDRKAAGLGLSRSAWVRMVVTQTLDGE
jgi:hypothetical protein